MRSFASLEEAKDFLNKKATKYTDDLERKWEKCSEGYIWCNNLAGIMQVLEPYSLLDPFAQEALRNFKANGYIEEFIQGGLKITPKGYQNIGAW
mgnify:CR=1 FL=1